MRARLLLAPAFAAALAGCSTTPASAPPSESRVTTTSGPAPHGSGGATADDGPGTPPQTPSPGDPAADPPPADGGCDGSFGEGVVPSLTVGGEQNCVLNGTEVDGDITVEPGGRLAAAGVIVRGGVTAAGPREFTLNGVTVTGRTHVSDGGAVSVLQSVLADVTITANTGPVEVSGNTISGALTCAGNSSSPTGGQNQGGARSGQCGSL